MGTRADFYIAHEDELEWLGSIAWDGDEIENVSQAESEADYRIKLAAFFASRDDATLPVSGWPWPWNDSRLTDCAYVYVDGIGVVQRRGDEYNCDADDDGKCRAYASKRLMDNPPADWLFDDYWGFEQLATVDCVYRYPNMKERANVAFDGRSGMIVISA